jgi:hypothetical protein
MGASSPASACSTTASSSPAFLSRRGSANGTTGDETSSSPVGSPTLFDATTFGPSEPTPSSPSSSSSEGSPARAPRQRASRTGSSTPRPFCGARWPEPLASFDPATSSWRTWRTSLLSTTEPSGERFSGRWPRSGSMSSGTAFQRQPSAPLTAVTGSSPLLPTPTAANSSKSTRAMTSSTSNGKRSGGGQSSPPALEDHLRLMAGGRCSGAGHATAVADPDDGGLAQHAERHREWWEGLDGQRGHDAQRRGVAVEWGEYGPAISRWRDTLGRPAPEPLVRGVDGRGAPGVERSRLSALGDGVQVQVGRLMGEHLLSIDPALAAATTGAIQNSEED